MRVNFKNPQRVTTKENGFDGVVIDYNSRGTYEVAYDNGNENTYDWFSKDQLIFHEEEVFEVDENLVQKVTNIIDCKNYIEIDLDVRESFNPRDYDFKVIATKREVDYVEQFSKLTKEEQRELMKTKRR